MQFRELTVTIVLSLATVSVAWKGVTVAPLSRGVKHHNYISDVISLEREGFHTPSPLWKYPSKQHNYNISKLPYIYANKVNRTRIHRNFNINKTFDRTSKDITRAKLPYRYGNSYPNKRPGEGFSHLKNIRKPFRDNDSDLIDKSNYYKKKHFNNMQNHIPPSKDFLFPRDKNLGLQQTSLQFPQRLQQTSIQFPQRPVVPQYIHPGNRQNGAAHHQSLAFDDRNFHDANKFDDETFILRLIKQILLDLDLVISNYIALKESGYYRDKYGHYDKANSLNSFIHGPDSRQSTVDYYKPLRTHGVNISTGGSGRQTSNTSSPSTKVSEVKSGSDENESYLLKLFGIKSDSQLGSYLSSIFGKRTSRVRRNLLQFPSDEIVLPSYGKFGDSVNELVEVFLNLLTVFFYR